MTACRKSTLRISPFSALYLAHSGVVVFFRNGQDMGFMRWSDKSLFVVTGEQPDRDLEAVSQAYLAAHSTPANDDLIMLDAAECRA